MQHPCVAPLLRFLSCYQVRVPLFYTKSFAFYALCFGVIPLCITICFSNKEVKVPWTFVKSWLRATEGGREKNFCYLAVEVFNSVCVLHTKHCLASRTARRREWFCPVTEFVKIPDLFPRSPVSQTRVKFHSKTSAVCLLRRMFSACIWHQTKFCFINPP